MREKLQTPPLSELKEMAKSRGSKGISSLRKAEIIDLLCDEAERKTRYKNTAEIKREVKAETSGARKRLGVRRYPDQETPRSQEISRGARKHPAPGPAHAFERNQSRSQDYQENRMTAGERITAALFQEGTTASIHRTGPRLPKHMETAV